MRSWEMPDWERGIGVAEAHASGPVRVIPVTPQMVEADRRRQQQQAPQDAAVRDWRARVLDGRTTLAPAKPPSTVHLVSNERPSPRELRMKPCTGKCGRRTEHSSGMCHKCRSAVE